MKVLDGFLVSSAMFTESSKPTIAKNASAVAEVIASSGEESESNRLNRLGSGCTAGSWLPASSA